MFGNVFKSERTVVPPMVATESDEQKPFIQLRKIVKTYSNAAGDFTVLKGINANFYKGEFIGVIGKSGSGKSTLTNMITGIDRPTSGEVYVGNMAVHNLTENQMAVWRGKNLGIVFQFFQLLPMLTLLENIMLPMDFCNMYTPSERKKRAMRLLDMVDMADHANKLPTAISGGQQQRVAIARALANDPPVLVADEPTGNLDSKTAGIIFKMFEDLVNEGKTIVMVTHDSSLARKVSRTLLIADGEIVNEYVARALPTLTHQQMLKATHNLQPLKFKPGATIIQQDTHSDKFYIITNGMVEVALKRPGGSDVIVTRFGPGQYFGEVELLRGGKNIANIRAVPETSAEVIALDRQTFTELLAESKATHAVISQIAEARLAENVATTSAEEEVS